MEWLKLEVTTAELKEFPDITESESENNQQNIVQIAPVGLDSRPRSSTPTPSNTSIASEPKGPRSSNLYRIKKKSGSQTTLQLQTPYKRSPLRSPHQPLSTKNIRPLLCTEKPIRRVRNRHFRQEATPRPPTSQIYPLLLRKTTPTADILSNITQIRRKLGLL
jgi:hypothetical protein